MTLSELLDQLHRVYSAVGDDCRLEVSIPIDIRDRTLGGAEKIVVSLDALIMNGSIVGPPYVEFVGGKEQ